jgi:3-keto-5-aminohexanoate cleavage enzyme
MFVASEKLVVEVALNEQTAKTINPHVPITPEELAADALAAAAEGAAMVHFHARDPRTGRELASGYDVYTTTIRMINEERPDLLVNVPYGHGTSPRERFDHVAALADDPTVHVGAAVIDPGSVNFSFFDAVAGAVVGDHTFTVSNAEFEYFLDLCGRRGLQCGIVVREPGQVRLSVAAHRAGWTSGMLVFKIHLSDDALWGVPPSEDAYDVYTRLVPDEIPYTYMSYTNGPSHWPMTRLAIARGAHVRVGIGDHAVETDGTRLTNAEAVRRVVDLATASGRSPAAPDEAREILGVD